MGLRTNRVSEPAELVKEATRNVLEILQGRELEEQVSAREKPPGCAA